MAATEIAYVITATDKATAVVDRFNQGIEKRADAIKQRFVPLIASGERFGASLSRLGKNAGLDKIGGAAKAVSQKFVSMGESLGRFAPALGAVTGVASIAGIERLTSAWADFGSRLGIDARRIGISANSLHALQGGARLAGTSAEALTDGMRALGDNLVDAVGGRAPQVAVMLNTLGVSMVDANTGAARLAKDALPEIADGIAAIKNPSLQARAAVLLFTGAGEALLPFLQKGSRGISEYIEAARAYGVQNAAGVEAARQFREEQTRLGLAVEGLGYSIAERLAPVLVPMLHGLSDWVAGHRDEIAGFFGGIAKDLQSWVDSGGLQRLRDDVVGFGTEVNTVVEHLGGWKTVVEGIIALKLAGWVWGLVKPLGMLMRLLALIPGSGIAGTAVVGGALGFEGAKTSGEQIGKGADLGLTPGRIDEFGNPLWFTDKNGKTYTPDEVEHMNRGSAPAAPAPRTTEPARAPGFNPHAPNGIPQTGPRFGPQAVPENYPVGSQGDANGPRGIRNNNPLNLSYVPGQVGLDPARPTDGRFGHYKDMESGVAQAERQLLLYQDRDHLNSVGAVIGKWAPPNENDTAAYVRRVAARIGVDPSARIDLHDPQTASKMIAAMARTETGREIDTSVVRRGVNRALDLPEDDRNRTAVAAAAPPPPLAPAVAPAPVQNAGPGVQSNVRILMDHRNAPQDLRTTVTTSGDVSYDGPRRETAMSNVVSL